MRTDVKGLMDNKSFFDIGDMKNDVFLKDFGIL